MENKDIKAVELQIVEQQCKNLEKLIDTSVTTAKETIKKCDEAQRHLRSLCRELTNK